MHATEKKAADIAMSEVDNCVTALQALESTWPGASKCKELLVELAQVAKENLAKVGKPKTSRHSSRGSIQIASPTGSNHERQEATFKGHDKNKLSHGANGVQQRLQTANTYGVLASPVHSTPSPPQNSPNPHKRPRDDTVVGRPLTVQDGTHVITKRSQPTSPEFGPEMQDRPFVPYLQQQVYNAPSWRLPSPPTYLSDPRFFANQAQDFSGTIGTQDATIASSSGAGFYSNQTSGPMVWGNSDLSAPSYESPDFPPFAGGMDFMQNFVPTAQMQGERIWENLPEVFNAEPRMFGLMDSYQDGM